MGLRGGRGRAKLGGVGALPRVSNDEIADAFERVADLLAAQHANPYRVAAYRRAASTLRTLAEAAAGILAREGTRGLDELPTIGRSLAAQIEELAHTGRLRLLDRLEGAVSPEDLFTTVPGIGEDLAHRIHATLGIETLEELEIAAHDGSLETVPGFGTRRVAGVRAALAGILSRQSRRRTRAVRLAEARRAAAPHAREPDGPDADAEGASLPSVTALLDFDAEYRRRAEEGTLRTIAPRRFNPEGRAWLPVLHGEREGWELTALFSNTARAHELGRIRDWVVIYAERDGEEAQCTVVTERGGPLRGRRVVRGREAECGALAGPAEARPPAID